MDASNTSSLKMSTSANMTTASISTSDTPSTPPMDGSCRSGMVPPQYVEMLPESCGHTVQEQQHVAPPPLPSQSCKHFSPQRAYHAIQDGFYPSWQCSGVMLPSPVVSPVPPGHPVLTPHNGHSPYPFTGIEYGYEYVPYGMPMFPPEAHVGYQLHPNPQAIAPHIYYHDHHLGGYTHYERVVSTGSIESQSYKANHRNSGTRRSPTKRDGGSVNSARSHLPKYHSHGEATYHESMTMFQFKGKIVEVAKEPDGSRFIQERLEHVLSPELQLVFDETVPRMKELWDDIYGNFILQKLLDVGTDEMKNTIGAALNGHVVELSTKVYGCRVLQKAFEVLDQETAAKLIMSLSGSIRDCIYDKNGNHVIQKAVMVLSSHAKASQDRGEVPSTGVQSGLNVIIDEIVLHTEGLSKHSYGCRVVQRMVEKCIDPQKSRILDSIMKCHLSLLDDQYGNYVIQRAIAFGRPSDRNAIFSTVTSNGNILMLSKEKHASNVVESMLKTGSREECTKLVQAMLSCSYEEDGGEVRNAVVSMAGDRFANYVLKTALDVLEEGEQRDKLFHALVPSLDALGINPYAKHIVSRIHTYLQRPEAVAASCSD
ncbi:hypothetical protein HJC23_011702 [Cyclotella cryptica]|uniref:PUM-HD domain-containing protein n=1 Tax=Cyclotella cryptica TaxID=29204 RepID=A0ABD3QJN3_9STRA|eukprot:CCRYP_004807-RB/>CCRYP_004807-RB protein AED:0.09 eAED:0.09 QI:464/1/1/1/0.6/0.5/6/1246/596